jgi:hypothetical protein
MLESYLDSRIGLSLMMYPLDGLFGYTDLSVMHHLL